MCLVVWRQINLGKCLKPFSLGEQTSFEFLPAIRIQLLKFYRKEDLILFELKICFFEAILYAPRVGYDCIRTAKG